MDGNCLYNAILCSLNQERTDHLLLRKQIYQFCRKNKKLCLPIFEKIEGEKNFEEHIKTILKQGEWGGLFELQIAAIFMKFDFIVYHPDSFQEYASYHAEGNTLKIYLEWANFNHFNSLISNLIEIKLNDQKELHIEESSQKKHDNSFKPVNEANKSFQSSKENNKSFKNQTQKLSTTFLYPSSRKEGNMYNPAYQYLRYKMIPNELNFSQAKDFKKYVLNHFRLVKGSTNRYSKSRLQFQPKKSCNWFTIPFLDEIPNILAEAHGRYETSVIKHNGIIVTGKKIKQFQLSWSGVNHDIRALVRSCKQCINQSRLKPCYIPKVIEPTWPLNRIVADLWTIPKRYLDALAPHQNHRYILTCIDHFSKYKWCFLIPNKEAVTILERLEVVFSTFTKPDIFQTDNGTEFTNQLVKDYCNKYNIKLIHGGVRHPQSQGVVEKINDFVATSLKSSYEDYLLKKENSSSHICWGIETALMIFVANQNNKPHIVTNIPPIELVAYRNRENQEHLSIIEKVKERIYSYYTPKPAREQKKSNKKNINLLQKFKVNTKVFIIGDVKKNTKNKSIVGNIPLKSTKTDLQLKKQRIPAIITDIENIQNNHIKVKVCGKANPKSIKENEVYDIHLKHIEIANEISWNVKL